MAPVSAVPGIPEDAQHLDSRVALQWAQPVLQAEKGQTARTALSVPLAVQIVKPFNTKGFESQGPDPDALLKGEVHPMLEEGLASWINFVLNKPAQNFRANAAQLNLQKAEIRGKPAQTDPTATTDITSEVEILEAPKVNAKLATAESDAIANNARPATQKNDTKVLPALLNLYQALANSEIFAAQRLSEAWLPKRVKPHLGEAKEAFNSMAQPIPEPSVPQLTKWVAALEPDSEHAQQAAQMLTQGQMVWQADLAPGIPMRMVREDAWRNQANKPAQLEKGATLKVEVELPNLGRIRIVGSQWGSDLSLQIAHAVNAQDRWSSLMPSLMEELQASGISDVRLETLSNETEAPNG